MANIYKWVIDSMNTKPQEGNLIDVVVCVNWSRTATTVVDLKEYYTYNTGSYTCPTPSETDFTAYPDLTYDQVCSWLDAGYDLAELDAYLDSQLENQINPPTVILPNPWETPNI